MFSTTLAALLAAMLAAAAPAALAQTEANSTAAAPPAAAPPAAAPSDAAIAAPERAAAAPATPERPPTRLAPGQLRFTDLDGATVHDARNKSIGEIEDVVIGRDGRVAAVVVEVGGFLGVGGKNVAIAYHELSVAADDRGKPRFRVDMTKEQLKSAQAYELRPRDEGVGSSIPPVIPLPPPPDSGK